MSNRVPLARIQPLEPRRLLASGDVGVGDVFRPDGRALALEGQDQQVIIDVTRLGETPVAWGLRSTPSATPGNDADDDAVAINAALEFVRARFAAAVAANPTVGPVNDPEANFALSLPHGDYTIRRAIAFREDPVAANRVALGQIRLLGESRDGTAATTRTTINAVGAATAYAGGFAIDLFTRAGTNDTNNRPGRNAVANFNLDVASNLVDAGIGGLQVVGANQFRVKNLRIIGSDTSVASLATTAGLTVRPPTSGLISNVTVEGFGSGVRVAGTQLNTVTLSNVTVRGQDVAGVYADGGQPTVENLSSQQTRVGSAALIPAIRAENAAAVTVLNGSFEQIGGAARGATSFAMVASARDASVSGSTITAVTVTAAAGYNGKLAYGGLVMGDLDGSLSNATYTGVASPGAQTTGTMEAKIRASLAQFNDFVRVDSPGGDDFGAAATPADADLTWLTINGQSGLGGNDRMIDATDVVAIEAAIANAPVGRRVGLHFSNRTFTFTEPLDVSTRVAVVDFGYGLINNAIVGAGNVPILRIAGGAAADPALVVSNVTAAQSTASGAGNRTLALIAGTRPVAFDSVSSVLQSVSDQTGTATMSLYLQNVVGFLRADVDGGEITTSARIYSRGINTEGADRVAFGTIGDDAQLFVAGFKTEDDNVNFDVTGNGRLFVLGGGSSQQGLDGGTSRPIVRFRGTVDAQVFFTASTWRQANGPADVALRANLVTTGAGQIVRYDANVANTPRRQSAGQQSYDYFVPYLSIVNDLLRVKNTAIAVSGSDLAVGTARAASADKRTSRLVEVLLG